MLRNFAWGEKPLIRRRLLLAALALAAATMIHLRPVEAMFRSYNVAWGEAPLGTPCHSCNLETGEDCPGPGEDVMECLQ